MKITAEHLRRLRSMSNEELIDVVYVMAEKHPTTFFTCIGVKPPRMLRLNIPFSHATVEFTPDNVRELRQLQLSAPEKKVSSIKRIHEITGCGLKEAKDLYESAAYEQEILR
jgi:hypothetical protein